MSGYSVLNLSDMIEQLGEDRTSDILSKFSCPYNKDIEFFLRKQSIVFDRQGLSKTQLVFTEYKKENVLVGFFAISNKTINVVPNALSRRLRDRIKKFAYLNKELNVYTISAPLIAQLGKNFSNGYNNLITGDELLQLALSKIVKVQSIIGGKCVYIECEDHPKLLDFYSSNGFCNFGKRFLDRDEEDRIEGKYLIQMLKYIS